MVAGFDQPEGLTQFALQPVTLRVEVAVALLLAVQVVEALALDNTVGVEVRHRLLLLRLSLAEAGSYRVG